MCKIIGVVSNKGGVGKTTTSACIAAGIARKNKRVLALDLDAQGSLGLHLGVNKKDYKTTIGSVIFEGAHIQKAIVPTYEAGLDVCVGSSDMCFFDIMLGREPEFYHTIDKQLKVIKEFYDFIVIDTPTGFSGITINTLIGCDYFLLPCHAEALSVDALLEMFVYLDSLRNSFSIGALIGILFTRVENTNTVRRQMRIIKSSFEEKLTFYKAPRRSILFKTSISKRIKVAEAAEAGRDVYRYDSKVLAGQQYEKLTSEILERVH